MDRSWLYLMALGFSLSWLVPLVGVVLMVFGALMTAIAQERTLISELAGTTDRFDEKPRERPAGG
ncbi:MAG TPA: hypothetical protein VFW57_06400 [Acidimicrobiia bacterium]|nr:hypothetical protein [Acidimicrobiia bacterium]